MSRPGVLAPASFGVKPSMVTKGGFIAAAVRADDQLLTCEPAAVLPMAQRYFLL